MVVLFFVVDIISKAIPETTAFIISAQTCRGSERTYKYYR